MTSSTRSWTSATRSDSDDDRVDDFAEIAGGQNPLEGRATVTGVVAALGLSGQASDIAIAGQPDGRRIAYLATGTAGLAIVDITAAERPLLLAELTLPSPSVNVEVDPQRGLVVVTDGARDFHVIDVSDAVLPRLLRTITTGESRGLILFDGYAYTGLANEIRSFDLATGEQEEAISLATDSLERVVAIGREGTTFLVITRGPQGTGGRLVAVHATGGSLTVRGTLALANLSETLLVADGMAWIATSSSIIAVDVSNPDDLRLINEDTGLLLTNAIALSGSGLGVLVSAASFTVGTLSVVSTENPAQSLPVLTSFPLPPIAPAVALSSGVAFVASHTSGLQVINFVPFDQGSTPPQVSVELLSPDIDPATAGVQMLPGATVRLGTDISDDVQIAAVELLLDGTVVRREVSYPFELTAALPIARGAVVPAFVQVRATDTGGNARLSEPIVIEIVPDLTPPTIVQLDPAEGSNKPATFRRMAIEFSEPIDATTVSSADFELVGASGPRIPTALLLRFDDTSLRVRYDELSPGDYQFVIHAASITDRSGNPLGTGDQVVTFRVGEVTTVRGTDFQAGILTIGSVSNYPTGRLQAVGDFNGDGFLDVVNNGGDISDARPVAAVLLGRPDGSFQASPVASPLQVRGAWELAAADFNHDGRLDLAAVREGLHVYLGNGDGTFGAASYDMPPSSLVPDPYNLTIGDFNNDGNPDVVVGSGNGQQFGSQGAGNAALLILGRGDGDFEDPTISSLVGLVHTFLTAADMDKDGNLDLVATGVNRISVLRGLGNATFERESTSPGPWLPIESPVPAGARYAAVADLNNDGILDVAVTGTNAVSVLFGNGDGSLQTAISYDLPMALDIAAGDYTGDGWLDLVVTDSPGQGQFDAGGNMHVLRNQRDGTFSAANPEAATLHALHPRKGTSTATVSWMSCCRTGTQGSPLFVETALAASRVWSAPTCENRTAAATCCVLPPRAI